MVIAVNISLRIFNFSDLYLKGQFTKKIYFNIYLPSYRF